MYRKIRNTFRFLLGNLSDFNPEKDVIAYSDLREVDQFMLVKLNELVKQVRSNYENYEFANIYHAINNFCTLDLSSFYLDFAKDFCISKEWINMIVVAIQTVLYESLLSLTKLVSPILSHTADEVWSFIPAVQEQSVQLTDMPEVKELSKFNRTIRKMVEVYGFT